MLLDIARTATDWPLGENLILFTPPGPWAKGGSGTDTPQNMYNIRIKRTNATQATAALARRIYLGVVLFSVDLLAVNGFYSPDVCATPIDIPDYITNLNVAVGAIDTGNTITVVRTVTEQV